METASNEMSNAFTQVCYHCEHVYEVCSVILGLIWKPILNIYVKFISSYLFTCFSCALLDR